MSDNIQLKEYVETILEEREKALRLTAANLEHRLNALNELRAEVTKDREQYLTREVYEQMHGDLSRRVDSVEKSQSRLVGIGIALVAVSFLIGIFISHLLKL